MDNPSLEELRARFPELTERPTSDHPAFNCPVDRFVDLATALRDELAFDMLVDVTGIDWDAASPRFTGIYHFLSTTRHEYLRIAVDCPNDIEPTLPSLAAIFPAADWHERETYDLMGIRYSNHPNLKRILMWEGYPYHPLRKDFPLAGIDTELPAADVAESTKARVLPAPMMGGPFVSADSGPMSRAEPRARDESWTETSEKPETAAASTKN